MNNLLVILFLNDPELICLQLSNGFMYKKYEIFAVDFVKSF